MDVKPAPEWISRELARLKDASLFRDVALVERGASKRLALDGKSLLNLSSNNYLGLSERPELVSAARDALAAYGAGSGASRLITGNYALYDRLERELAAFKGAPEAVVTGSGYMANLAIFTALADRETVVFSDKLNHASIIDGVRLSGAKQVRYRHNDPAHLARLMDKETAAKTIVVTDSIFSMDGDGADIPALAALCKARGALLVVDEAHATGIFGQGRGLAFDQGAAESVDAHMGTFSKALGSYGGYVACGPDIAAMLRNKGRSFIFTTALPPAVIGANLAAVRHVAAHPEEGRALLAMACEMRDFLRGLGFNCGASVSQIIPVILGDNAQALRARDFLMGRGLYAAAVRPPTVPAGTARLRLSLRADLSADDLDAVRAGFAALREELGQCA